MNMQIFQARSFLHSKSKALLAFFCWRKEKKEEEDWTRIEFQKNDLKCEMGVLEKH
jgi:hypothetical protein